MDYHYYLETLIYLQKYEDDEYHEIEHLFENIERIKMLEIIRELDEEGLILARNGFNPPPAILRISSINDDGTKEGKIIGGSLKSKYYPFEAKITLKGILQLKTFQMKNEINIHGDNNNVIQNSSNVHLQAPNSDSN